jgi:hypothetical protein
MKLVKIISIIAAAAGIALSTSCGSASAPAQEPTMPATYIAPAK